MRVIPALCSAGSALQRIDLHGSDPGSVHCSSAPIEVAEKSVSCLLLIRRSCGPPPAPSPRRFTPSHRRHHPPAPDHRPGPARPLRAPATTAPTRRMALAPGLAAPVRRPAQAATSRPTRHNHPRTGTTRTRRAGQTGGTTTPIRQITPAEDQHHRRDDQTEFTRWIQVNRSKSRGRRPPLRPKPQFPPELH